MEEGRLCLTSISITLNYKIIEYSIVLVVLSKLSSELQLSHGYNISSFFEKLELFLR